MTRVLIGAIEVSAFSSGVLYVTRNPFPFVLLLPPSSSHPHALIARTWKLTPRVDQRSESCRCMMVPSRSLVTEKRKTYLCAIYSPCQNTNFRLRNSYYSTIIYAYYPQGCETRSACRQQHAWCVSFCIL